MSKEIEENLDKIPVVRSLVKFGKSIKLPSLGGFTLYDLLELYIIGIVKGAFSYRASAIAFSFFMALFPFALFILNLIPYIPLEGFQDDFMRFVADSVPPNTYEAVAVILNDILNKSYKSLLSSGILLSIFLMSNGMNAILGGFETSYHITITRGFFKQYAIAIGMSILMSFILIITVAAIVIAEIFLQKLQKEGVLVDQLYLIKWSRYIFVLAMILVSSSFLFKFGTKEITETSFISHGSVFTTISFVITSYVFGIYVERFAQYNELYGSIGTLLVFMMYIWINCMVLLLGFELNASIHKLKIKNSYI